MKKARMIIDILMVVLLPRGIYDSAAHQRGISDYLLMKMMFAFFDFSESRNGFLLDYAAIMVLVAEIAFWVQSGLLIISSGRQKKRR